MKKKILQVELDGDSLTDLLMTLFVVVNQKLKVKCLDMI